MSRDRLGEFKVTTPHSAVVAVDHSASSNSQAIFYEEVIRIEKQIEELQSQIDAIDQQNQRSLQAVGEDQINRSRQESDALTAEVDQHIRTLQKALEVLGESNRNVLGPPEQAARRGRTAALTRQFQTAVEHYRDAEDRHWSKSRERLERQYKVAKPTATTEEVQAALDDERAGQIFTQSLLSSTRIGEARRVMKEVETRQREMRQIEKKALELNALFIRLNEMATTQQEMFDTIEVQVQETVKETEAANHEVTQAIEIRKRTRQKMWILTGVVLVVIAIIAIVVAVKVV
ncbi:hypothetical protein H4R33_005312 [Dimargaris cristalligena]|uniref:t-SNARE n=1 Tax=Dimargaris cristalligena TaxID=215637 RepID=A0A4P9ZQA0_9FUNG|nr:hypothetical protein H4R33_005312 [Dimargaris cristalligena]RKP34550.1 t-SNARE [Dimargaris cristalligena]|eukprot:RKP34550.1 t-SNARE [Dimargaris cristalligena]